MATETPESAQGEHSTAPAADTAETRDASHDAPVADGIEALIERWFADHFHGSPIATNNEHYQHAWGAKEALKRLIKGQYS
jgi:hypothetical protein